MLPGLANLLCLYPVCPCILGLRCWVILIQGCQNEWKENLSHGIREAEAGSRKCYSPGQAMFQDTCTPESTTDRVVAGPGSSIEIFLTSGSFQWLWRACIKLPFQTLQNPDSRKICFLNLELMRLALRPVVCVHIVDRSTSGSVSLLPMMTYRVRQLCSLSVAGCFFHY